MIKVITIQNGLGNKLFMYCFGRILAYEMGYELRADPIPGFPATYEKISGYTYPSESGFPVEIIDNHVIDFNAIVNNQQKRTVEIRWPVQGSYAYYKPYAELIKKEWLYFVDPPQASDPQDLILHVRRGDFVREARIRDDKGFPLPFSFYKKLLSELDYRQLFIVTDDPHDKFFKNFKKYGAIMLSSLDNPFGGWNEHNEHSRNFYLNNWERTLSDFKRIASFNNIVLSPSSFSWWAAYLSNAAHIYVPFCRKGYWSDKRSDISLRVDEPRYHYIHL